MIKEKTAAETSQVCPGCGKPLASEGDLLRCAEHGEFFSYGPRLLVRVPRKGVAAPLMPWQTLGEKTAA